MNSTKAHIAALSLLDRSFIAMTDDELAALVEGLPEDHVEAVRKTCGLRDDDETPLVEAVRTAAHKGRLNGDLQRLGLVLSDTCLKDCIDALGDKAELPAEEDLQGVLPGLIDKHGLGAVRMMLASTVVGEAPASATIIEMLKHDDTIKLPPIDPKPIAPLLPPKPDDKERLAIKAQRRARKAEEQAAARLRREQIARARRRP